MDPLKPFSSSIRLLWERATQKADSSRTRTSRQLSSSDVARASTPDRVAPVKSLQSRLQGRLSTLKAWDSSRARALFVESVVLDELGETLGSDPNFDALVQRVSGQLGADRALCARLDYLLKQTRDGVSQA